MASVKKMQSTCLITPRTRIHALHTRKPAIQAGSVRHPGTVYVIREPVYRAVSRPEVDNERDFSLATKRDEDVQTKQYYTGKKALVVGSGPAGSIAASFLVKQGFRVDVYEKRKDPIQSKTVPDRSISLILSRETANVMREVGIELPSDGEGYVNGIHPYLGNAFLTANGEVLSQRYDSGRFLVQRHDLARHLLEIVRNMNPEITFHFEHPCDGANLMKQEVQFHDQDNNTVKQDYDLLVGADGASSEVRKAMQEQINNFKVHVAPRSVFYKSYRDIIVDVDKAQKKYRKLLEPGYLASYPVAKSKHGMEGLRLLLFFPVANGKLAGNLSGTKTGFASIKNREKEYLNDVLPGDFPTEWIDQILPVLIDNPMHELQSTIVVSSLIGPNAVLIGDAGHSVSPTIGIGCNMAIQDGQALNDALQFAKGDINAALEKFNDVRHKKVKEWQQLEKFAVASIGNEKGINPILVLLARMHTLFHLFGNRYLPQLISEPATFRFGKEEITAEEALQTLQLELASLFIALALILLGSFKTVAGVL